MKVKILFLDGSQFNDRIVETDTTDRTAAIVAAAESLKFDEISEMFSFEVME